MELHELADGLWGWRQPHPEWKPGLGWDPPVNSFLLTTDGLAILMDALVPEPWPWLDERVANHEVHVVQLKPDHDRSRDELAERYRGRVWKPGDYFPGDELPGGLVAQFDGRFRGECPMWIPEHRTLVFADAVISDRDGDLRIWWCEWHREYVVPAFRRLLELPVERVLVAHGAPIAHDGTELERALARPLWQPPSE